MSNSEKQLTVEERVKLKKEHEKELVSKFYKTGKWKKLRKQTWVVQRGRKCS